MSTRRNFLKAAIAGSSALAAGGSLGRAAAQGSDYKALVCINLHGGADAQDFLVPNSASEYARWAELRAELLGGANPASRERSALLPLGGSGDPAFGFVPELSPFKELYDRGRLAVVGNVGPLLGTTSRADLTTNKSLLPPRLGSHNDHQSIWQTGGIDGTPVGWAGLLVDELGETDALSRVTVGQARPLAASNLSVGVRLRNRNMQLPRGWGQDRFYGSSELPSLIERNLTGRTERYGNMFMREVVKAQTAALQTASSLSDILTQSTIGTSVAIQGNALSEDLGLVADLIAAAPSFGINRQVFVVSIGGWDSHADHFSMVPDLQTQLARAMKSFTDVMEANGLGDQVTTFTLSEFGRTLQGNSSGTDHGWGGYAYVAGGAVRGGRVVGEIPPYDIGHDQDWRRGAMIPTLSVEQYAASLGRWFGVDEAGISRILPNLSRFDPYAVDLF
jgi:uncharacterized protein (DUF1501 family)